MRCLLRAATANAAADAVASAPAARPYVQAAGPLPPPVPVVGAVMNGPAPPDGVAGAGGGVTWGAAVATTSVAVADGSGVSLGSAL
jgi:hypothetical protein